MAAALVELFEGHSEDIAGQLSVTVPYGIFAATDEAAARVCALTIPTTYNSLPRQSITGFEQINETTWKVVAKFAQPDASGGSDPATLVNTYTFEIGGGTQNVKQGRAATVKYPAGAAAMDGINFDGQNVNGVDIVTTQYQWSETYWFSDAAVTTAYKTDISSVVGTVNDATFRGFPAGEVLFLGASGSKQGNGYWQITFKFARERNVTGLTVGAITGIAKTGWQYMWVRYEDAVAGTGADKSLVKTAKAVYVETVYMSWDFDYLDIGA
jgi:hypothetical protein